MHQQAYCHQVRVLIFMGLAACGGQTPEDGVLDIKGSSLEVWAEPSGQELFTTTEVSLASSSPAEIYYTLDGTEPTGPNALQYSGPIEVARSTLVSFIAIGGSDKWSQPRSELYVISQAQVEPMPVERALTVDDESLFFLARVGTRDLITRRVKLKSRGLSTVTIDSMLLGRNPQGSSFWHDDAFRYEILTDGNFPLFLRPQEELELEITYVPTDTLASGAIIIESDDLLNGGELVVELWGRSVDW